MGEIPERVVDRFNDRWTKRDDGCHEWTAGKGGHGYGVIYIGDDQHLAHRLSWRIANDEEIPDGKLVLHTCHNRECVNADHLYLGDRSDNMKDAMAEGTAKTPERRKGEDHHNSSLTREQVEEIKEKYENTDASQRDLAAEYGVSQTTIYDVLNGRSWKDE